MKFPSVTTILKHNSTEFDGIPEHILKKASERGNDVHNAMEAVLQGRKYKIKKENYEVFVNMIAQLNHMCSTLCASISNAVCEKTVYHYALKYSGQLDYTFKFFPKGRLTGSRVRMCTDYKTTSKQKHDHLMQIAAYIMADYHMRKVGDRDDLTGDELKNAVTLVSAHGQKVKVLLPDFESSYGSLIYSHKNNKGIKVITGSQLKSAAFDFIDVLEDFGKANGERLR